METGIVNISINNNVEQFHYKYDDETATYTFDEDIRIGDWTIKKTIKLGGPRTSIYKYDFKNYLEFVIIDRYGISRIKSWHYNYNSELNVYGCDGGSDYALSYFCNEFQAFKYLDWNDYDANVRLKEIQSILERTDNDNTTKYERIKNCINQQ